MQSLSRKSHDRDETSAAANGASDEASPARDRRAEASLTAGPRGNDESARAGDGASAIDAFSQDQALDLFEDEEPHLRRAAVSAEAAPASAAPAPVVIREIGPRPNHGTREEFTNTVIENFPPQAVPAPVRVPRISRQLAVTGLIVLLSLVALVQAVFLIRNMRDNPPPTAAVAATGVVTVQSTPPGAAVTVNGQARGVTPLSLTLNPGDYTIEIASGGLSRAVPVTVAAGTRSSQHVVFGGDATASGALQVTSQPPGARVTIDDVSRGVTPLTVADLAPGAHVVVLDGGSGATRQNVTIQPGATASLAVTMPAAGTSGGFVRVISPFDVQLYEEASLIGSNASDRIMLPAGRHTINVVNSALGYQSTQTVQVVPGATATIRVEPPTAIVDVNAVPWADVTVGGRAIGTTPLGNVQMPIGSQEIIFRHPQLGERRVTANVTVRGPNRISVNMNQK